MFDILASQTNVNVSKSNTALPAPGDLRGLKGVWGIVGSGTDAAYQALITNQGSTMQFCQSSSLLLASLLCAANAAESNNHPEDALHASKMRGEDRTFERTLETRGATKLLIADGTSTTLHISTGEPGRLVVEGTVTPHAGLPMRSSRSVGPPSWRWSSTCRMPRHPSRWKPTYRRDPFKSR